MQFCKPVDGDVFKIKPPIKYGFKTKKTFYRPSISQIQAWKHSPINNQINNIKIILFNINFKTLKKFTTMKN